MHERGIKMAGHSKWATTKHRKFAQDAKRSSIFQKLAKEIYVAAKSGDPDPLNNSRLRLAIEKAKSENMPKENIERAIKKATNNIEGESYEEIRYEGYGPYGIAIMVDCLTDNRNRTAASIRSYFNKYGGKLGTDGSVSYLFQRRGIIVIDNTLSEDEVMEAVIDAGALDFNVDFDFYEIITMPEDFLNVKKTLEDLGVKEFIKAEVVMLPNTYVNLKGEEKEKVQKLLDVIEEDDDVQAVYHNLDLGEVD